MQITHTELNSQKCECNSDDVPHPTRSFDGQKLQEEQAQSFEP